MDNDIRRLATVERIGSVRPIPDADAIEAATVRGWTVVVKKGEFNEGDLCVYFEIDAFLPARDERFSFLESRGTKTFDDVQGYVLKTARLRGVYSQGLVLPLTEFPELDGLMPGAEVTEVLGIVKYEPPVPAELAGEVVGPYPTQFAPKTDAERVQNLAEITPAGISVFEQLRRSCAWIATEKVDGTSTTFINDGGTLRYAGRNYEYASNGGTAWKVAAEIGVLDMLEDGMACQGELFGEGIQKNPLRIKGQRFVPFALYKDRTPVPRSEWPEALDALAVPVLDLELPDTIDDAVSQVDGIESSISPGRKAEGVVWHSADGSVFDELRQRSCFKVISNRYLLKQ